MAISPLLTYTVVATCDREIFEYIESIGGRSVMTAESYERASDRCAEAIKALALENGLA